MIETELNNSILLILEELELLSDTTRAIRIYSLTFVTRWFGFAIQSFYTAVDKPVPATILSVGNACVFPLVLMAMLWSTGLDGLWFNSSLTSLLVAVVAGLLVEKHIRMRFKSRNESMF